MVCADCQRIVTCCSLVKFSGPHGGLGVLYGGDVLKTSRSTRVSRRIEREVLKTSPHISHVTRARIHRSLCKLLSPVTACFANVQMCRCANVQIGK